MTKRLAFGSLLLVTTQLVAPAALAQEPTPPAAATAQPQDQAEETPEISAPGIDADAGQEIVVTGRNIPNIVRATPQVISVLTAEDIARTGEGDIAGALTRVTGLSVVGSGFVFVRGLGDRYSSSMLNGSPLPSPEPLKRSVPLDIFPTTIVASALVQKTYSANYPGEFGGGVINLTTRAIPEENFLQIGGSATFDTVTTSELGYTYDGGKHDWLGYDSGERDVPDFVRSGGLTTPVFNSVDVAKLTNAETTVLFANYHIPVNWGGDLNFGLTSDIGSVRTGVIASASASNTWRTRDAIQQDTTDTQGALRTDQRTVLTDMRAVVNGLLGFGAEFGDHKVRWTNVYIHDTLKQGRLGAATVYPNSSGDPVVTQNTNWFERQLVNTQLTGEFKFDDWTIGLRGSYANTQRNAPYERAISYRFNRAAAGGVGAYQNSLNNLGESSLIAFSELNEDLYSGQADVAYKLPTARPITVSAGYFYSDTQRDSFRYDFRFRSYLGGGVAPLWSYLRADLLHSYDAIYNACATPNPSTAPATTGCIRMYNLSGAEGAAQYDALLRIHAGYGQIEGEIADGLRATLGVRYERAEERISTSSAQFTGTALNNEYWLPALTVTWNFARDMQLRLHGSKTIARPQFRELAPQVYRDFESDRLFFGNPQLVDSELKNFEARFEWFMPKGQRITAAAFYKDIKNPTEQVAFYPTNESPLQTGFSYAPSARLYGGEFEVMRYLPLDTLGGDFFATRRLMVSLNYTYTQSEIQSDTSLVPSPIQNGSGLAVLVPANLIFRDGAPLTGQSDHLVNAQIGIEDTDSLSQLTFLFNYASDRVTNRGPNLLPDIIEKPGIRFDIVARQGINVLGGEVELKFEARNLTGTRYEEFQDFGANGKVLVNSYRLGRTFSLSGSVKF